MLVTLRQILDHAAEYGYGIPAFNINNMEQGLAILKAANSVDAPVILQASPARGAMQVTLFSSLLLRGWMQCSLIFLSACIRITEIQRRPA